VTRDFQPGPAAIDTRRCGDITYIPTQEGWLYLATVIDIASRRVVGWATADHLRTELVADALRAAWRTRRPSGPVVFHSDRGCQYTSREFALLAGEFDVDCRWDALVSAGTVSLFAPVPARIGQPRLTRSDSCL